MKLEFKKLIIFGDSLQDNGNLSKFIDIPKDPYNKGRFANDSICCEYFLSMINESQKNIKADIDNYAIGGALTSGINPKKIVTEYSLPVIEQVRKYCQKVNHLKSTDLIMLNGGANNFLFFLNDKRPYFNFKSIHTVASDLFKILKILIKHKANKILVWNIPDITCTPAYSSIPLPGLIVWVLKKYIRINIQKQNKYLFESVCKLNKDKLFKGRIYLFDINTLLKETITYPKQFGFKNVIRPCIKSFGGTDAKGNIQENFIIENKVDESLFWDYVHPTSKAHALLAQKLFDLIDK